MMYDIFELIVNMHSDVEDESITPIRDLDSCGPGPHPQISYTGLIFFFFLTHLNNITLVYVEPPHFTSSFLTQPKI